MKYLVLFFILFQISFSQEPKIANGEGTFTGKNIDECKRKSLEIARQNAIEQVVGIKVASETYYKRSEIGENEFSKITDAFSTLSRNSSYGKIVEEKILSQNITTEKDFVTCITKIEAQVFEEPQNIDNAFQVEIKIENPVLLIKENKGDELKFKITSTKDCYIYLFAILSNDSVQMLIPNKHIENSFHSANKTVQVYENKMQNIGMKFISYLPEDKNSDIEALYLIALKEKIDYQYADKLYDVNSTIVNINKWLISIPSNLRTESFAQYEIRKVEN